MANDFRARGAAARNKVSLKRQRAYLALADTRGKGRGIVPEVPPCLFRTGSVVWAAATSITAQYVLADDRVYWQEKPGTSGGTKPTSRAGYVIDNSLYLSFMGELAPVAFAISTAMVLGRRFYANGNEYKVTVAGTTSGAGTGPSTAAGGTDGTVTYIYLGPQTKPVATFSASAPAGTTSQAGYTSSKVTIMGGVAFDDTGNGRRQIRSLSSDGIAPSAGGGKFATQSDAPLMGFYFYNRFRGNVWVDGELVVVAEDQTVDLAFLNLDFTGMPRKMRSFVFEVSSETQFIGLYATAFDTFAPYVPDNAIKAVWLGDSFVEPRQNGLSYANRMSGLLGIEDLRVSGLGGTGLVQTNGALVNYQSRFAVDVVNAAPDFVFIQMTPNDQNGVPGSWSTATVNAALASLIARARAAGIVPVVVGPWNNRGAQSATVVTFNTDAQTLCSSLGVAFVSWMDFITDGGFVGSPSGSGNSLYYTEKDGTHPSFSGAKYRAQRLAPMLTAAIAASVSTLE